MSNRTEISVVRYLVDGKKSTDNVGNLALYARFDDNRRIVFAGIRSEDRVSTKQAALDIVADICEVEDVDPDGIEFYDLRTCCGYQHLEPGKYEFMKLEIKIDPITKIVSLQGFTEYVPSNAMERTFRHLVTPGKKTARKPDEGR